MPFQFSRQNVLQWEPRPVFAKPIAEVGLVSDDPDPESGNCRRTRAIALAGHGRTRKDGYWQLNLRSALCAELDLPLDVNKLRQASVVATVIEEHEGAPLAVAVVALPSSPPFDWFGVRTLTLNGGLAGNVPFAWHAVIEIGSHD